MSIQVHETMTVREIIGRHPKTRKVFEQYGIDYCCGGGKRLADAAGAGRASVAELIAALAAVDDAPDAAAGTNGGSSCADPAVGEDKNWFEAPLRDLIEHIIKVHHAYLRDAFPSVRKLAEKVLLAHGREHGEMLREVHGQFGALEAELTSHMAKEEMVLFPYIAAVEAHRQNPDAPGLPSACFGSVRYPIHHMEAEHEVAGNALRRIREVTGDFSPPADACPTFRALYEELEQMEKDLHQHVHLENNILFPRAIEAEATTSEERGTSLICAKHPPGRSGK